MRVYVCRSSQILLNHTSTIKKDIRTLTYDQNKSQTSRYLHKRKKILKDNRESRR